jgi:hypothetical protein
MNQELLDKIKRLTIKALVSDDYFMEILYLKGGNALDIIHNISQRVSIDIDFSMKNSFDDSNLNKLEERFKNLLEATFGENGLKAYDVKLSKRPNNMKAELNSFWGGYKIEFKLIQPERFTQFSHNIDKLRKSSIPLGPKNSTIFRVEISRFEVCPSVEEKILDGYTINVYSPTLIAIEKLRAICQQMEEYSAIVLSATRSPRARDFFDIYSIINKCNINLASTENRRMIKIVFAAKRVPIDYIKNLEKYREFHRTDFVAVKDTIKPDVELMNFDFYFDFVKDICDKL